MIDLKMKEGISVDLLEKQLMKCLARDVAMVEQIIDFWGEDLFNQLAENLQSNYKTIHVDRE